MFQYKLTDDLTVLIQGDQRAIDFVVGKVAEVERLRAALQKYVCDCPKYACQYFPCGEMARAALETPNPPEAA